MFELVLSSLHDDRIVGSTADGMIPKLIVREQGEGRKQTGDAQAFAPKSQNGASPSSQSLVGSPSSPSANDTIFQLGQIPRASSLCPKGTCTVRCAASRFHLQAPRAGVSLLVLPHKLPHTLPFYSDFDDRPSCHRIPPASARGGRSRSSPKTIWDHENETNSIEHQDQDYHKIIIGKLRGLGLGGEATDQQARSSSRRGALRKGLGLRTSWRSSGGLSERWRSWETRGWRRRELSMALKIGRDFSEIDRRTQSTTVDQVRTWEKRSETVFCDVELLPEVEFKVLFFCRESAKSWSVPH